MGGANGQRAHASQRVERIERRRRCPVQHAVRPDLVEQFALAADDTERGVVVAGDALGRRVQREVHAERQRLLTERGGERGVDQRDRAAQGTELGEVDQFEQRVRRRLGDGEHGAARSHRGGERARLGAVDERDLDAEPGTRALQEREGGRVQLPLRDDVRRRCRTARARRC